MDHDFLLTYMDYYVIHTLHNDLRQEGLYSCDELVAMYSSLDYNELVAMYSLLDYNEHVAMYSSLGLFLLQIPFLQQVLLAFLFLQYNGHKLQVSLQLYVFLQ